MFIAIQDTYAVITLKNGKKVCDLWQTENTETANELTRKMRGESVAILETYVWKSAKDRQAEIDAWFNATEGAN